MIKLSSFDGGSPDRWERKRGREGLLTFFVLQLILLRWSAEAQNWDQLSTTAPVQLARSTEREKAIHAEHIARINTGDRFLQPSSGKSRSESNWKSLGRL